MQEVAGVDDSSLSISTRLVFYVYWNDSRVIRLKVGKFIHRPKISTNLGLGFCIGPKITIVVLVVHYKMFGRSINFFTLSLMTLESFQ